MERGSTKHGPQLDDELARQARSHTQGSSPAAGRADETMEQEPPGEDQPEPTLIPQGQRPSGAPSPLTGAELEARSRLGRAIPRSALPGEREALLQAALANDADADITTELERLPAGRRFHTIYEVWEALGYRNEDPPGG